MITALAEELNELLAPSAVSADPATRRRASRDGSHLSPIITAKQPLGLADLVVFPRDAAEIAQAVAAAVRHGVAVTVRGKGTCNYGQGIPMGGGLVVDTTRARAIEQLGEGWITAEAGATMYSLERAANHAGQQLWMYPSTIHSTLGGFLSGGSGGTGSIAHGTLAEGFVQQLDVVYAAPEPLLRKVTGADLDAFLHSYGTAGVICRARVNLEPLREWVALYASFDSMTSTLRAVVESTALEPSPRLVSADPPLIAGALPADPAIPSGRCNLRVMVAHEQLEEVRRIVTSFGGRVEAERSGFPETVKMSVISFNHAIEWLQRAHPGRYFHLEISGGDLLHRYEELAQVYPGGVLHVEGMRGAPVALLAAEFVSEELVYEGFARVNELGFAYHNVHQWNVDVRTELVRQVAAVTDPLGLLNPGKLARATAQPAAKPAPTAESTGQQ